MVIQAQTTVTKTIFEDSFEAYKDFSIKTIGNWTTLDLDRSRTVGIGGVWQNKLEPQAFIVFNPMSIGILDPKLYPKTGAKFMGAFAALMPDEGGQGPNNDWLISPPILLEASANEVSFWVKSLGNALGVEAYEVGVYTGAEKPTRSLDFTIISGARPLTVPSLDWEQKTFNLDTYANQTVRIGIHFVAADMHLFMIDDFKVTTGTLSATDFFAENFSVFPNPTNDRLNIKTKNNTLINNVRIVDLNGKTVVFLEQLTQEEVQIQIDNLTAGTYFILIKTNTGTGTSRFLKN